MASILRFIPNVLGFLGGTAEPTPIRQAEMNRLLGRAEDSVLEEVQDNPYTVGESVKVKVMVMIFGRQNPLELSFMQVSKEE